jgi:hypothetical protein
MASKHVVAYNPDTERLEIVQVGDEYLFKEPASFLSPVTLADTINGRTVQDDGAKLDLITVTGAVDLDALESSVGAVTAAVVLKGTWDASTLLFPASTKAGDSWICSIAGLVDGIQFDVNDRVVALIDDAPNNAYAGNWHKLDYTDEVLSVAGKTGAVTLLEADISDLQSYLLPDDIDTVPKLNAYVGDTLLTAAGIDTLAELNAILGDAVLDDENDPRPPTTHSHTRDELSEFPFQRSYSFRSQDLNNGINYLGGFYDAPAADTNLTQASTTQNYGSANASQGAHAFIVFGAGSTDGANITLTVSGTSIADDGTRTPADSEVLFTGAVAGLTADDYLETDKRWIGQITYTLTSDGVNFTCDFNYGFAAYEKVSLADAASITRVVAQGLANATDANFNVEVLFHADIGWEYSAAAFTPGGITLLSMVTDEAGDSGVVTDEHFSYQRSLSQSLETTSESVLVKITTSVDNSITYMDVRLEGLASYEVP